VLALAENLGRVGLVATRVARSGDRARSESRLAIPSLPLYKPVPTDDRVTASGGGLAGRAEDRGYAEPGAVVGLALAAMERRDELFCLGAAVGKRRYRARLS
jgi:hypothetical protein